LLVIVIIDFKRYPSSYCVMQGNIFQFLKVASNETPLKTDDAKYNFDCRPQTWITSSYRCCITQIVTCVFVALLYVYCIYYLSNTKKS